MLITPRQTPRQATSRPYTTETSREIVEVKVQLKCLESISYKSINCLRNVQAFENSIFKMTLKRERRDIDRIDYYYKIIKLAKCKIDKLYDKTKRIVDNLNYHLNNLGSQGVSSRLLSAFSKDLKLSKINIFRSYIEITETYNTIAALHNAYIINKNCSMINSKGLSESIFLFRTRTESLDLYKKEQKQTKFNTNPVTQVIEISNDEAHRQSRISDDFKKKFMSRR